MDYHEVLLVLQKCHIIVIMSYNWSYKNERIGSRNLGRGMYDELIVPKTEENHSWIINIIWIRAQIEKHELEFCNIDIW